MDQGEDQITSGVPDNTNGGELPSGLVSASKKRKKRLLGSNGQAASLDTGAPVSARAADDKTAQSVDSAKFIGTGFVAMMELFEGMVHSSSANKIERKFPSKLVEFKEMSAKMGLQEKDKETMSACVEKIALKYSWMTNNAPELVLAIMVGQYTARQVMLMKFVENVTKKKQEELVAPNNVEKKTE